MHGRPPTGLDSVRSPRERRFRVAVTGHRNVTSEATVGFVRRSFGEQLARIRNSHPEGVVAISGLAAGADSWFAEIALRGGLPLEVGLAYTDFIEDFAPGPERQQFKTFCALSQSIHQLPFNERSSAAYLALGHWLVDTCDLLIAAWDGLPARGLGGTGDVVAYARQRGRPVIHIHTLIHAVELLQ